MNRDECNEDEVAFTCAGMIIAGAGIIFLCLAARVGAIYVNLLWIVRFKRSNEFTF